MFADLVVCSGRAGRGHDISGNRPLTIDGQPIVFDGGD